MSNNNVNNNTVLYNDSQYKQYILEYVAKQSDNNNSTILHNFLLYIINNDINNIYTKLNTVLQDRLNVTNDIIDSDIETRISNILIKKVNSFVNKNKISVQQQLINIVSNADRQQLQVYYQYTQQHPIELYISSSSDIEHINKSNKQHNLNTNILQYYDNSLSVPNSPITPTLVAGDEITIGRNIDNEGKQAKYTVTRYSIPRQLFDVTDKVVTNKQATTTNTNNTIQSTNDINLHRPVLQRVISDVDQYVTQHSTQSQQYTAKQQILQYGGLDELTYIVSYLPVYFIYGKLCFVNRRFFAAINDYRLFRHIKYTYLYAFPSTTLQCSLFLFKFTHLQQLVLGPSITNNVIKALTDRVSQQTMYNNDNSATMTTRSDQRIMPHLTVLSMRYCTQFDSSIFEHLQHSSVITRLTKLDLTGCNQISDSSLACVIGHCKSLVELTLTQTSAGIHTAHVLANNNILLHKLDLSDCRNIDDESLSILSSVNQHLISINLSNDWRITVVGVQHICFDIHDLQVLDLSYCYSAVTEGSLHYIGRHCTKLQQLILYGCSINDTALSYVIFGCSELHYIDCTSIGSSINKLTDITLRDIASYVNNITYINMSGCNQITNQGILALSESCKTLHILKLAHCTELNNTAMEYLSTGQAQHTLQQLDVSGCYRLTDQGIAQLLRMTSLNSLNIAQCVNVTDRLIVYWSKLLQLTSKHTDNTTVASLKELDLSSCTITDKGLTTLPAIQYKLHKLLLTNCTTITDKSIDAITQCFIDIQYLSLKNCSFITDISVNAIAQQYSYKLTYLNLNQCELITDYSILQISIHCQQLEYLLLEGCKQLTDNAIQHIAKTLSKLNTLNISQCTQLTSQCIQYIIYGVCRYLRTLNVSQIPSIATLVEQHRNITNINNVNDETKQLINNLQRLKVRGVVTYT